MSTVSTGVHDPILAHAVALVELALDGFIGLPGRFEENFDDEVGRPLNVSWVILIKRSSSISADRTPDQEEAFAKDCLELAAQE